MYLRKTGRGPFFYCTWQEAEASLFFLMPHVIAPVGQAFLHRPQRMHSGLFTSFTGSISI